MLRIKNKRALVITAGVVVAGAVIATAAIAAVGDEPNVYTGCLSKDGTLSKVAAGDAPFAECGGKKKGETQIQWRDGKDGLPGKDGTDGKDGVVRVRTATNKATSAGVVVTLKASCPRGYVATGGGGVAEGPRTRAPVDGGQPGKALHNYRMTTSNYNEVGGEAWLVIFQRKQGEPAVPTQTPPPVGNRRTVDFTARVMCVLKQ